MGVRKACSFDEYGTNSVSSPELCHKSEHVVME